MNTVKIALTGAIAASLALVGTPASAESIRSASSLSGVMTAKKAAPKAKRTAAPVAGELNAAPTGTIVVISAIAAAVLGYTVIEVLDDGNVRAVSPGT